MDMVLLWFVIIFISVIANTLSCRHHCFTSWVEIICKLSMLSLALLVNWVQDLMKIVVYLFEVGCTRAVLVLVVL